MTAHLRAGDLLFLEGNAKDPFTRAVRNVTVGIGGAGFSHVGMFDFRKGVKRVLEALPEEGVVATPLEVFFGRVRKNRPLVVGRLKEKWRPLAAPAADRAAALVGRPYNELFELESEGFYCAELIWEAYRTADGGRPLFPLRPMTFKNPATGAACPLWSAYFAQRDAAVPEGRPGLNPGALSLSDKIEILSFPIAPALCLPDHPR